MVDALVVKGDEGRGRLRYASGSCQTSFDPKISEWGNLPSLIGWNCYQNIYDSKAYRVN